MSEQWVTQRVISRRRALCLVFGPAWMAPAAWAQQPPAKLARVGFLVPEALADQASRIEALRAGLAERGWVEGRNLVIEVRSAEGAYERLPALAAELASLKMDVIVAFGIKSLTAARAATTTLPIVIPATSSDLVALGFVERFARPGKNVTGSTTFGPEIMAKRLELLKETAPASKRVGVLVNPANASFGPTFTVMSAAARSLKLSIEPFEVRDRSEFPRAFAAMAKARIDGLVIQDDTIFGQANADEIAALAAQLRLLAVGGREFADAGGAIGYGRTDADLYRRGAYFVDRILNGAKPADLPVEQATRFEIVINLPVASAIGIRIPQPILLRADRVIR
jgi:putative ABC transport system substrate-binding protein